MELEPENWTLKRCDLCGKNHIASLDDESHICFDCDAELQWELDYAKEVTPYGRL